MINSNGKWKCPSCEEEHVLCYACKFAMEFNYEAVKTCRGIFCDNCQKYFCSICDRDAIHRTIYKGKRVCFCDDCEYEAEIGNDDDDDN